MCIIHGLKFYYVKCFKTSRSLEKKRIDRGEKRYNICIGVPKRNLMGLGGRNQSVMIGSVESFHSAATQVDE